MIIIQKRKRGRRIKRKKTKVEGALVFSLTLLFLFAIQYGFCLWEKYRGLVAGTDTDSITVSVNVEPSISIDSPANVTLAPDIQETGSATGSATWNVKTNNSDGWKLEVEAGAIPAMADGGNSFADYGETVEGTPETWSVDASDSEFGFGASGTYAEAGFGGAKYMGFNGANEIQVAHRHVPSDGAGDDTTINFKAEVGASKNQTDGVYSATITATATTL